MRSLRTTAQYSVQLIQSLYSETFPYYRSGPTVIITRRARCSPACQLPSITSAALAQPAPNGVAYHRSRSSN